MFVQRKDEQVGGSSSSHSSSLNASKLSVVLCVGADASGGVRRGGMVGLFCSLVREGSVP